MSIALKRRLFSSSVSQSSVSGPMKHTRLSNSSSSKDLKENMSSRIQGMPGSELIQPKEFKRVGSVQPSFTRIPLNVRNSVNDVTGSLAPLPSPSQLSATLTSWCTSPAVAGQSLDPIAESTPILRRPVGALKRCNASHNLLDMVSAFKESSRMPLLSREEQFNAKIKAIKRSISLNPVIIRPGPVSRTILPPRPPPVINRRVIPPSPLCDSSFKPPVVDTVLQRAILQRKGQSVPPRPPIVDLLREPKSIENRSLYIENSHSLSYIFNDVFGKKEKSLYEAPEILKEALVSAREIREAKYPPPENSLYPAVAGHTSATVIESALDEDDEMARVEYFTFNTSPFSAYDDSVESFSSTQSGSLSFDDDDFVLLDSPGSPKLDPLDVPQSYEPDSDGEDEMDDEDEDDCLGFTARPRSRMGISPPGSPSHSRFHLMDEDYHSEPESSTTVDTFEMY